MNMRWIVGFTILIFTFGMTAAFGLAGTDILNPITSQAEANRIAAETRHLDAMNQLEEQLVAAKTEQQIASIRHDMELEEARYQADLARIAADQIHYERMLNIKASAYENFMTVLLILSGATGVSIIVIMTKFALVRIQAPALLPTSSKQQNTHHRNLSNYYEQMKQNARQRERSERELMLRIKRTSASPNSITSEEYQRLGLAGD